MGVGNLVSLYLRMIKFSHSVFALPFAFTAAVLAAGGIPKVREIVLIAAAMVGARSAAMGFNRIIDRDIDRENPRTSGREIPAGKVSVRHAVTFSVISLGVMVAAAYFLNPLCFKLSPLAMCILVGYSYAKRFTPLSHIVLGLAISGAPLGAWIAIRGSLDPEIVPLVVSVILWLAGFDILYALQDIDFDRRSGLHSIPARIGAGKALVLSRVLHALTWILLVWNGYIFSLRAIYLVGMLVVAALLLYEHSLVREDDLSKLNMAFFNMNGYISIIVFVSTVTDVLV